MNKKHLTFLLVFSLIICGYFYKEYISLVKEREAIGLSTKSNQYAIDDHLKKIEKEDREKLLSDRSSKEVIIDGTFCKVSEADGSGHSVIYFHRGVLFYADSLKSLKTINLKDVIDNQNGGLYSNIDNEIISSNIIQTKSGNGSGPLVLNILKSSKSGELLTLSPSEFPGEVFSKKACGKVIYPKKSKVSFKGNYCKGESPYELVEFRDDFYIARKDLSEDITAAKLKSPYQIGQIKFEESSSAKFINLLKTSSSLDVPKSFFVNIIKRGTDGSVHSFAPRDYPKEIFSTDTCLKKDM